MDAVNADVEGGLLARFADRLVDLLLGLIDHFFDARRMNPPVDDQTLQGQARHFPAHRVEARDDHRLGGIVDDQIDAGGGFDGADVAPFPADNPPFHLVGGQRHHAHRLLGDVVAGIALDCQGQNLLGLFVGAFAGFVLDLLDTLGSVVAGFALHALHQPVLGLLGAHAGDALEAGALFGDQLLYLLLPAAQALFLLGLLLLAFKEIFLATVDLGRLAIEVFLPLQQALFLGLDLPPQFAGFLFPFALGLDDRILGLDDSVLAQGVGLLAGRLEHLRRLAARLGQLGFGALAPQQHPDDDPNDYSDQHRDYGKFYLQNPSLLTWLLVRGAGSPRNFSWAKIDDPRFGDEQVELDIVTFAGQAFHNLQFEGKADQERPLRRRRKGPVVKPFAVSQTVAAQVERDPGNNRQVNLIQRRRPSHWRLQYAKAPARQLPPLIDGKKRHIIASDPGIDDPLAELQRSVAYCLGKNFIGYRTVKRNTVGSDEFGSL